MRQRWTIRVDPAIGSGPSGYSPDKGTSVYWDNNGGTSVAGLNHDMSPDSFDTIQLIELKQGFVCRGCLEKWIDDYLFMLKPWDKSEWEEE